MWSLELYAAVRLRVCAGIVLAGYETRAGHCHVPGMARICIHLQISLHLRCTNRSISNDSIYGGLMYSAAVASYTTYHCAVVKKMKK